VPDPRDAQPHDARRGIARPLLVLVLGVLVTSCGLCSAAGVFLYVHRYDVDAEMSGDLSSDAPGWSAARVGADSRIIMGAPLPASASNVHYRHAAGIDVSGVLRADVTEPEFRALMAATRLTPWSAARAFTDDTMWLGFDVFPGTPAATWWTPPSAIDESVWVSQVGSVWRMARYDGRTMWFAIVSH